MVRGRLRQPLLLVVATLVLVVMGACALVVPLDDTLRLDRVRQAGEIAAEQAGMLLQADVAVACLIVQSFPQSGQGASLQSVITALVHNHPTISNVVIVDSTGHVVLDVLHHGLLAQSVSASALSTVPPGEWRDIGREGTGGRQSMLVRASEPGVADAYFGVMQTEQGTSPRHIYVLNSAHAIPVSSMGLGQTWLLGDDGMVLARSDLQDATLDPGALGQHWRSSHANGEVSGTLTMAVGGRDHLLFYRQLDGWPATLVIDAGAVEGDHPNLGFSPMVRNGLALCLVLAAGAMAACAVMRARSSAQRAMSAAVDGHGVPMRQLAGVIAHDLNNLLMVMMVDTDKVVIGFENEEAQGGRRQLMREATKRGLSMSQTLLAYSERLILCAHAVDLCAALEQHYAECAEILLPQQSLLLALPKPGMFTSLVSVDPRALNACLLNMVHHIAAVAAPSATIRVDLRMARRGSMVVLTMSDGRSVHEATDTPEGVGKVAEFRSNFQDGRMGLALPAAAGFARQSGGAIEVASAGDAFLRISLYLPVHMARSGDHTPAGTLPFLARHPSGRLSKAGISRPGGPVRIVVADDSILVRHSVVRWLGSDGYSVMTADSVAQAVALLDDGVDLLITDIVFGEVEDGFALALKARERDPLLPLVFMSGFLSARQPLLLAGDELASFVRKPIGGEELRAVVDGLLALRETRRLQPSAILPHATLPHA